jgi:hypothetical protein
MEKKIKKSVMLEMTPYVLSWLKAAADNNKWSIEQEIVLLIERRMIDAEKSEPIDRRAQFRTNQASS